MFLLVMLITKMLTIARYVDKTRRDLTDISRLHASLKHWIAIVDHGRGATDGEVSPPFIQFHPMATELLDHS